MIKQVAVLCLLLILAGFACTGKKEMANEPSTSVSLTGTWELRQAQAGMMPTAEYSAGNGNRWQFTDATFQHYTDGTLSGSGSYQLVPDTTASASVGLELPPRQFKHRLILKGDTTEKTFIDLRGDTLEMISGFFPVDAGSRKVFIKTNDRP